jgi:hypothetical protein
MRIAPKRKVFKARPVVAAAPLTIQDQEEMKALLGPRIGADETKKLIDLFNTDVIGKPKAPSPLKAPRQPSPKVAQAPSPIAKAVAAPKRLFKKPVAPAPVRKPRPMELVESSSGLMSVSSPSSIPSDVKMKSSSVDILAEIDDILEKYAQRKKAEKQERIAAKMALPGDKRKLHVAAVKPKVVKRQRHSDAHELATSLENLKLV